MKLIENNVMVVDMTAEEYQSVDSTYLIVFDDNNNLLGINKSGFIIILDFKF